MPNVTISKEPKVVVPSQTIQLRNQDGKRIVQMWLADDSFTFKNPRTGTRFRLNKQALPEIAKTIIGHKYIIPPDLDHPHVKEPDPYDVNLHIERINNAGQQFEAGTFFDIHPQNRFGNDGYDAFAEMDTELGKRLFDAGLLPRYNSTSILKLDFNEPEEDTKKAIINNVCAVKYPNYGIRASLQGMCVGDRDDCKTQLLNNSSGTAATSISGELITLNMPCPTMEAIKQLPDDSKFDIGNNIFNNAELTNSSNQMSAVTNPGTTDATVTYNFPKSERTIKVDSKGMIIHDTHPNDKLPEGFKGMANPPAVKVETERPEGNGDGGNGGNGDNNQKGGEQSKNANGALSSKQQEAGTEKTEQQKKEETILEKKEDNVKESNDTTKNDNPKNEVDNVQVDRISKLESEVKELSRYKDDSKYYRSQLIKEKLSRTNLKQDQKDEDLKRWEKMPIHGEELEFALSRAYPAQGQEVTAKVGERRNSAYIDDGEREINNSAASPQDNKTKKLTVDLLQRKQQTI